MDNRVTPPKRVTSPTYLHVNRLLNGKAIKNSSEQMGQQYTYDRNESTHRLVEDGISTELTNMHTFRGFSGSVSSVRSKTMHSVFFITS